MRSLARPPGDIRAARDFGAQLEEALVHTDTELVACAPLVLSQCSVSRVCCSRICTVNSPRSGNLPASSTSTVQLQSFV
ncbi:hypothetical protein MATL_G00050740 [Megalops atlanticus]|uniref:Uncharacterized protein n=1 Tax=Megalops atlanticus TaxID=7932 RepID=A0A9D3QFY9_MEGAT|nr:hypothetical protein MATL_G00050740 [Megalops atlanticus]